MAPWERGGGEPLAGDAPGSPPRARACARFAGATLGEGRPLASSEETRQVLLAGAVGLGFFLEWRTGGG